MHYYLAWGDKTKFWMLQICSWGGAIVQAPLRLITPHELQRNYFESVAAIKSWLKFRLIKAITEIFFHSLCLTLNRNMVIVGRLNQGAGGDITELQLYNLYEYWDKVKLGEYKQHSKGGAIWDYQTVVNHGTLKIKFYWNCVRSLIFCGHFL